MTSSKRSLRPAKRQDLVDIMRRQHGLSIRRSCTAVSLSRTVYAYQPRPRDDGPIIVALTSLTERPPRYGFGKLFRVIRRQGHHWNHKRVYRVYGALKRPGAGFHSSG